MTLKAYFSSVFALLKRRAWLPALWFLLFFFALPVQALLVIQARIRQYNSASYFTSNAEQTLQEMLTDHLLMLYGPESNLLCALVIGMAVVTGLAFSAYLFQKKQVDFYHSQPVKRQQLFARNYLAGALAVLLPYLLNLLLMLAVCLIMGGAVISGGAFFWGLGTHLLYFLAVYGTVLLAAMLCGNLVVAALSSLILLGALPALFGLVYTLVTNFYPTVYHALYSYDLLVRLLSPAAAYILAINGSALNLLLIVLFDALVAALALLLYRRRPSEGAGQAVVFKIARSILKYLVALLAGVCGALLFYTVGLSVFWYYFGAVFGVLLATQVVEIIYHFDFKAAGRNWGGALVFLLIFLVLASCGKYDLTGYNSYTPAASRVASAEIILPGVNGYVYPGYRFSSASSIYTADNDLILVSSNQERERMMLAQGPVTDPAAIAALCEMGALFAHNTKKNVLAGTKYNWDVRSPADNYNYTGLKVVYTLNSGRQVARDYSDYQLPVQFLLPYIQVIYGQEDFREAQLTSLRQFAERSFVQGPNIFELASTPGQSFDLEYSTVLMQSLVTDLADLTVERQLTEMPIGSLPFYLTQGDGDPWQTLMDYEGAIWHVDNLPIYASFEKTLALLAADYPAELWQVDPQDVLYINVEEDNMNAAVYDEASGILYAEPVGGERPAGRMPVGAYEDPAEILAFLQDSYDTRAYGLNCFRDYYMGQSLEVVYGSGADDKVITRYRYLPL